MLTPTITFRGVRRSRSLEADIAERLQKLETYYPRILGCRVLVELVQRHRQAGNRYHVRIDLTIPGGEIVVTHEATLRGTAQDIEAPKLTKAGDVNPVHKHARVAIHDAFDAARRRLQDFARRQGGSVKHSERPARGTVAQLFPIDQYGYIEADDGHAVYFQKSSVLNDRFDRLDVGVPVSYVEESGDKGPQASTVRLLHPRHAHRASQTTKPRAAAG